MDALLDFEDALARRVYDSLADLLNLEVDLFFFDTSSTYFELDENRPGAAPLGTRLLRPRWEQSVGNAPTESYAVGAVSSKLSSAHRESSRSAGMRLVPDLVSS
ncbi:MAG: putative transposase for insertion sequence element [Frankiales bacterium]|nr:putative transposase for insertion sequence element [Frankiales bacterium]